MEQVKAARPASYRSLVHRYKRHADQGPSFNQQQSKQVRPDLYEFKSKEGDRLAWFYHPTIRGLTVLTHGFEKGNRANQNGQLDLAEKYRDDYLAQEEQTDDN